MKGNGPRLTRSWILLLGGVVLVAGHAYVLSHVALSAAVMSGLLILVVIKPLGLLAAVLRPLAVVRRFRD